MLLTGRRRLRWRARRQPRRRQPRCLFSALHQPTCLPASQPWPQVAAAATSGWQSRHFVLRGALPLAFLSVQCTVSSATLLVRTTQIAIEFVCAAARLRLAAAGAVATCGLCAQKSSATCCANSIQRERESHHLRCLLPAATCDSSRWFGSECDNDSSSEVRLRQL